MDYACHQQCASLRMACCAVGIFDSVYRYQSDVHRNDKVIAKLQEAVERYPAYGFSKLVKILRRWGHGWNHKREHNVLRGYAKKLRMDNGLEFISVPLATWAEENDIELEFIKPGKPTHNSYVERFNRTYRNEILNMYVFRTLNEVRHLADNRITEYNDERPHDSLNDMTLWEYLAKENQQENPNYECT